MSAAAFVALNPVHRVQEKTRMQDEVARNRPVLGEAPVRGELRSALSEQQFLQLSGAKVKGAQFIARDELDLVRAA